MKKENSEVDEISILVADESHLPYVQIILTTIEEAAKVRGTGIARRTPEYIELKIKEGKAIIALTQEGVFAGFCYVETWGQKKFVANSGLIVVDTFRGHGLAKRIKQKAFQLSRERYPDAKIFGLTTGLAVMKINSDLGYRPVTFSELTNDEAFWKGCQSCVNYDILQRTSRKHCLCTGMLFDPTWNKEKEEEKSKSSASSLVVKPVKKPAKITAKIVSPKKKSKIKKNNKLMINLL